MGFLRGLFVILTCCSVEILTAAPYYYVQPPIHYPAPVNWPPPPPAVPPTNAVSAHYSPGRQPAYLPAPPPPLPPVYNPYPPMYGPYYAYIPPPPSQPPAPPSRREILSDPTKPARLPMIAPVPQTPLSGFTSRTNSVVSRQPTSNWGRQPPIVVPVRSPTVYRGSQPPQPPLYYPAPSPPQPAAYRPLPVPPGVPSGTSLWRGQGQKAHPVSPKLSRTSQFSSSGSGGGQRSNSKLQSSHSNSATKDSTRTTGSRDPSLVLRIEHDPFIGQQIPRYTGSSPNSGRFRQFPSPRSPPVGIAAPTYGGYGGYQPPAQFAARTGAPTAGQWNSRTVSGHQSSQYGGRGYPVNSGYQPNAPYGYRAPTSGYAPQTTRQESQSPFPSLLTLMALMSEQPTKPLTLCQRYSCAKCLCKDWGCYRANGCEYP